MATEDSSSEALCQLNLLELLLLQDEAELGNEAGEGERAVSIDPVHVLRRSWVQKSTNPLKRIRVHKNTSLDLI